MTWQKWGSKQALEKRKTSYKNIGWCLTFVRVYIIFIKHVHAHCKMTGKSTNINVQALEKRKTSLSLMEVFNIAIKCSLQI
jgi:hypothetical protein